MTLKMMNEIRLAEPNIDSVYFGVVSLRGIHLVTFFSQLNKLELRGTYIGNAYLEATTKEKFYIIGGTESGALEGHRLVVYKAVYGLSLSGLCWHQEYIWSETVYGHVKYEVARDLPQPLGNSVVLVSYVDANLQHSMLTGRSVTGVLHIFNHTLVDWYSERQECVQTATFGSEFVAAIIAVDHIVDLRCNLWHLGAPGKVRTYILGDNQAEVSNSAIPHSCLSERHNRESIATIIIIMVWINGKNNPADIASKHWSYPQIWHMLQAILLYSGYQ
jgi:hypothetical protein